MDYTEMEFKNKVNEGKKVTVDHVEEEENANNEENIFTTKSKIQKMDICPPLSMIKEMEITGKFFNF